MVHTMRPMLEMESKEMVEDEGAANMDVDDIVVDLSVLEFSVGLRIGRVKYMLL